ncbi:ABC transporter ATP-binding protein [Streptomyces sp. SID11385]|uniref:ATP-binding cassette domain-containing protein n=1 Tax=Streptomyces sp. SID11385 TaxID=2706031 RepID=UPI0013C95AF6|nr:ABC transporter ATP-binding protein [Streptomyces sp. SID11385]
MENLTVRYRRRTALDGLSLSLGPGVHGLLGPNGAGKSTLVRVLATVTRPEAGRVRLHGHDLASARGRTEARRLLGYLPQEFGYYRSFTVREFLAYVAWLKEVPADDVPAAVERALARTGLGERGDSRLRELSGGMVRRAGIAQALVNDPALLLLDEPTAGLDPEQRVDFRALLREVGRETTVLVSTHLVEDVAQACTEVTLLEAGRLVLRTTPADLARLGAEVPEEWSGGGSETERGYTAALRAYRENPGRGAGA